MTEEDIKHIVDLLYTIYQDKEFAGTIERAILNGSSVYMPDLNYKPKHIDNPTDKEKILLGLICKLPAHDFAYPNNIPDIFILDLVRLYAELYK